MAPKRSRKPTQKAPEGFLAAEAVARGQRLQWDQARIHYGRLAVLHCLAIDGVAQHLDEGRDRGIFGDEHPVPVLARLGPDQHQLEGALPYDAAADALEYRRAVAAIGGVGLGARRGAAVGIGGALAE